MKTISKYAAFLLLTLFPLGNAGASPDIVIETAKGDIEITLDEKAAPKNVAAFLTHMRQNVYQESSFHHLHEGTLMGGKPGPSATGGHSRSGNRSHTSAPPGEFTLKHTRGALVMARTVGGCNPEMRSNSTQFAIYRADHPESEKKYTVIGYVTKGMEIVDEIAGQLGKEKPEAVPIKNVRKVDPK